MMMAVTSSASGVLIDQWVYEYRMHPGQMTKAADFHQLESLARRCAWQRGALLAAEAGAGAPTVLRISSPALA